MAETKANTSQSEVLALVIDRETSSEVSRINKEIGQSIYFHPNRHRFNRLSDETRLWNEFETSYQQEQCQSAMGKDTGYEELLIEYTQAKLYLHNLRKSCYYRGDPYCEREDIDVKAILDRCDELKQMIKEKRRGVRFAVWGEMEPQRTTVFDKPLLYAFDDYTCSFTTFLDEETQEECPLKGEHWYHGNPYCRAHLGEIRRLVKLEKRRRNGRCHRILCSDLAPHYHLSGKTHFLTEK